MEARQLEDEVEIEGGAPASVSDVGAASGADQIVSEGSQASGDVGVLADAGSVLGKGGVAHVVAAVLDPPMGADQLIRPHADRAEDPVLQGGLASPCFQGSSPSQVVRQIFGGHAMEAAHPFVEPAVIGIDVVDMDPRRLGAGLARRGGTITRSGSAPDSAAMEGYGQRIDA